MYADSKTLVFVPTYNERGNVETLCHKLIGLNRELTVLFIDDNSPDGTGETLTEIAKKHPRIKFIQRPGKQGIGSAHKDGIRWAYANNYTLLVTMDCDSTHRAEHIPDMLRMAQNCDIVIGSRFISGGGMVGWNRFRKTLSNTAHFLTKKLLGLPYDSTGAFRVYRLDKIPQSLFDKCKSNGYSFLFESLFILKENQFCIKELPVNLMVRKHGHSKMKIEDAMTSAKVLFRLFIKSIFTKKYFICRKN